MITIKHFWIAGFVLVAVMLGSGVPARAGRSVNPEWWLSGGVIDADYHDSALAVARGGVGVRVLRRFSVGADVQVDRVHWFGFGYAGVTLPAFGLLEPFGRFQVGRRDDVSDTALEWSAGLAFGEESVKLTLEVFGVLEPGSATGVCFGFAF
jgi:hypothetical protein